MDRGRSPDDGPDEIEAASDNDTIDPTVEAGTSLVPVEEEAAGAPDGATEEPDGAAAATDPDGDGRPAAWLADIRARAPWLLEQAGALQWRASAGPGSDIVPHGEGSPAPSAGDGDIRPPVAHPPGMSRVQDASSRDRNEEVGPLVQPSNLEGASVAANRLWPDPWPGVSERLDDGPDFDDRIPAGGPPPAERVPPSEAPDDEWARTSTVVWPPTDAAPAAASSDSHPDTDDADERSDRLSDHLRSGPDLGRPVIHRPSAAWPRSTARPASASPMWPHSSVRPEGAALPHGLPTREPDRPLQRPITPFLPDRLPPHPATSRPTSPTWAEDRNGWHAGPVPFRHLVDEAALPPWPSLFDDDGDEEDEPDWTALQRGFERMLRLDGEQRRR